MIGDVALKAFVGTRPLSCALFDLNFATTRSPVTVVLGPADDAGELHVTDDEIRRQYEEAASHAGMNCGPWSGEVFVGALNREMIRDARRGFASWHEIRGLFPPDYLGQLDRAERALEGHDGEVLRVVASSSAVQSMLRSV
jgi:hypothetical protein